LVFAGPFDDEFDAVVGGVGLQGVRDGPAVAAGVVNRVGDRQDRDDVCGGATEED